MQHLPLRYTAFVMFVAVKLQNLLYAFFFCAALSGTLFACSPTARAQGTATDAFVADAPPAVASARDPIHKKPFPNALLVRVPRGDDQDGPSGWTLAATVHFAVPEDTDNARKTAYLFARLIASHRARFGRSPDYGRIHQTAHVWITPDRSTTMEASGGETKSNNIYIYDSRTPRTRLEWTRTVVHEWGHLTLLAARGYRTPEHDAAGYLAERLYMNWLRSEIQQSTPESDEGNSNDGLSRADLELYFQRQIAPLVERYLALPNGPRDIAIYKLDSPDAMDLYIGAILCADAAFGSQIAAKESLDKTTAATPRAFFAALRDAILKSSAKPRAACWLPIRGAQGWKRIVGVSTIPKTAAKPQP